MGESDNDLTLMISTLFLRNLIYESIIFTLPVYIGEWLGHKDAGSLKSVFQLLTVQRDWQRFVISPKSLVMELVLVMFCIYFSCLDYFFYYDRKLAYALMRKWNKICLVKVITLVSVIFRCTLRIRIISRSRSQTFWL